MSLANIVMLEFESEDAVDQFLRWYEALGFFPGNQVSLWVRTGETSVFSINVYPDEETAAAAIRLRDEKFEADGIKSIIRDIITYTGDTVVAAMDGKRLPWA